MMGADQRTLSSQPQPHKQPLTYRLAAWSAEAECSAKDDSRVYQNLNKHTSRTQNPAESKLKQSIEGELKSEWTSPIKPPKYWNLNEPEYLGEQQSLCWRPINSLRRLKTHTHKYFYLIALKGTLHSGLLPNLESHGHRRIFSLRLASSTALGLRINDHCKRSPGAKSIRVCTNYFRSWNFVSLKLWDKSALIKKILL